MNKKATTENLKRRKLILRPESVAMLTLPRLRLVVGGVIDGGSGDYWPCGSDPIL
jgi:hypothetical protein